AYYQQILSREKLWRQSLSSMNKENGSRTVAEERLRKLEKSIDNFADRFPNRSHGVDILLMAASANSDMGDLKQAERYWNRVLLSDPNATLTTIAIRGLVQATIRAGDPQPIPAITRNYLKLENFFILGAPFRSELYDVLSTSVKDAAK